MDAIDEKLLLALRENGRASTAQLARLVGRSRTSVQSRIERLEKQGVIVGYGVLLAPEHGVGAVRAHVMIKVGPKETRIVTAALRAIAQVRVLHSVSGEVDLIAVAATASVADMDQVIDRIGALDGVERTTSSIILSTKFERASRAPRAVRSIDSWFSADTQAGFFSTLRGIAAAPRHKFGSEIGAGEPDAADDDHDHQIVNAHVVSRCALPGCGS